MFSFPTSVAGIQILEYSEKATTSMVRIKGDEKVHPKMSWASFGSLSWTYLSFIASARFLFWKIKRVCSEKWEHHLGGVGGDRGFVFVFFYFLWGDLCVFPDWKAQGHVGQSGNISFWDMGDAGPSRWVHSSNVSVKSRLSSLETFSVLLIPSSISVFQVGWLFHHFRCSFLQYWHF